MIQLFQRRTMLARFVDQHSLLSQKVPHVTTIMKLWAHADFCAMDVIRVWECSKTAPLYWNWLHNI